MALINELTNIGNAIREKTGGTELIPLKEMASAISGISSGTEYTNIVYNADNTVTLTDKDGVVHTMACTYENGKLIGVTYDGEAIDLTYAEDLLLSVSGTSVDMNNAPATSGSTLNIAYGETAPEDTSKLWIKANEPNNIVFGKDFKGAQSITTLPTVLPKPLWNTCYGRVGSKIYIFGGETSSKYNYYNRNIYVYDIETGLVTTQSTEMPRKFYNASCATVGTDIYLFGGASEYNVWYNTIYKYDTITDTLTLLNSTLPSVRGQMGCETVGTKVYLFGGYLYNSSASYTTYNTIMIFDTETETITTLPVSLPAGRRDMGCTSIGNNIYLLGGYYQNTSQNTIWKFDTQTETITVLDNTLPQAWSRMGCTSIGNKIYLIGGRAKNDAGTEADTDMIYIFDTNTNTFELSSVILPYISISMVCVSSGVDIYLLGGYPERTGILKFTATKDLVENNIEVITGSHNYFNVVNTDAMKVEIGVDSVLIGNAENQAENCEAYLHNGTEWKQI